ncbi:major capsid protein [Blackfly microvirus SF02]|uniref:Major capsid protein n=1 Tax=Blackfly microvirus SF02 TaxID=2576452 RepID=A0A4P8PKZ2_9VIRU|nr:major capsid protein [Blackfly microvirus SF02]
MKLFDSVGSRRPRKNKFDLSHEKKFTCEMGTLVPIMVQEVLPGDSFRARSEILLRFAPLLAPTMHRFDVFTHFFYVPNRITWVDWQDAITGGRDGTLAPVSPTMFITDVTKAAIAGKGTLGDYFGLPLFPNPITKSQGVCCLPFRAYQLIYDEFFRDQNLTDPVGCSKLSGDMTPVAGEIAKMCTLRKRAWEKDYFTSALPWTQRGGQVMLPTTINYKPTSTIVRTDGTPMVGGDHLQSDAITPANLELTTSAKAARIENIASMQTTINDLRQAVRMQEWLEKNARGGARYVEQILSHFGVMVPDSRLQRPEYLGGGRAPVSVSEVLSNFQISTDPAGLPQGNMAGHGISVSHQNGFSKTFVEHGFVIGLMSILPRTAYQQGVPRYLKRGDRFTYAWPEFANLGEQEILNSELYADGTAADDATFGYQSRYAEYKYQPSTVHGEFKDTLDFWHDGRKFAARPVLNEGFVMSSPDPRIFAVPGASNHMYVQCYNKVDALRPLPYYGTPML